MQSPTCIGCNLVICGEICSEALRMREIKLSPGVSTKPFIAAPSRPHDGRVPAAGTGGRATSAPRGGATSPRAQLVRSRPPLDYRPGQALPSFVRCVHTSMLVSHRQRKLSVKRIATITVLHFSPPRSRRTVGTLDATIAASSARVTSGLTSGSAPNTVLDTQRPQKSREFDRTH